MKNIDNKPLPEPADFYRLEDPAKLEAHIRLVVDYNNLAFLANSMAHQVQELTLTITALRVENASLKLQPAHTVEELEAAARKFAPAPALDNRPSAIERVRQASGLALQVARDLDSARAHPPEGLRGPNAIHFCQRLDSQRAQAENLSARIARLADEAEEFSTATASAS